MSKIFSHFPSATQTTQSNYAEPPQKSLRISPIKEHQLSNRLDLPIVIGKQQMRGPCLSSRTQHVVVKSIGSNAHDETNQDHSYEDRNRLLIEKHARTGKAELLNHLINFLKNADRHGQSDVRIEVGNLLDTFRQHKSDQHFHNVEHIRNLSIWLQEVTNGQNDISDTRTLVAKALIHELQQQGFSGARLERRFEKQTISLDSENGPITQTFRMPVDYIRVTFQKHQNNHSLTQNQSSLKPKLSSWLNRLLHRN